MTTLASHLEDVLRNIYKSGGEFFPETQIESLSNYYRTVLRWNKRLHLTTITQPATFVQRHILESELAAYHLSPAVEHIYDLGSGLGVPGIPIAIFRPDLPVTLVEASRAKVIFLEETISELKLGNVRVIRERIESLDPFPADSCLAARAIEEMRRLIPTLFRLGARSSQLLLYGTPKTESSIRELLTEEMELIPRPIPDSRERFLFDIRRLRNAAD